MPGLTPDPDALLARLDEQRAEMARRVLVEGIHGWRRWSTICRRAGEDFSPILVEVELLDDLCREAGVMVEDAWHRSQWVPRRFVVDESLKPWLGILDPEVVRTEVAQELHWPQTLTALEQGPPRFTTWRSFAFALRAADRILDFREHGIKPDAKELAGLIDYTKAWTPARRRLVTDLLGTPWDSLVSKQDRQIGIRGHVIHKQASIWASRVRDVELELGDNLRGCILVENLATFKFLLELADDGWVVLHIPGGPPPAEIELVSRLSALAPNLPFFAAFDLDPAGIRIARHIEKRGNVKLKTECMEPELLEIAPRKHDLSNWDRTELDRLANDGGGFKSLIQAMKRVSHKAEQEPLQRELLAVLKSLEKSA